MAYRGGTWDQEAVQHSGVVLVGGPEVQGAREAPQRPERAAGPVGELSPPPIPTSMHSELKICEKSIMKMKTKT